MPDRAVNASISSMGTATDFDCSALFLFETAATWTGANFAVDGFFSIVFVGSLVSFFSTAGRGCVDFFGSIIFGLSFVTILFICCFFGSIGGAGLFCAITVDAVLVEKTDEPDLLGVCVPLFVEAI